MGMPPRLAGLPPGRAGMPPGLAGMPPGLAGMRPPGFPVPPMAGMALPQMGQPGPSAVANAIASAQALARGGRKPGGNQGNHMKSVADKRKLLWGDKKKKEEEPKAEVLDGTAAMWASKALVGDQDGARKMKFMKLMGAGKKVSQSALEKVATSGEVSTLEGDLERQYEESRMHTHTARKAGFGRFGIGP